MIELISKSVKMNERTFEPEIELVIRLPLELTQDDKEIDSNFFETLGKKLESLL